jgi:hypothetical protein
VASSRVGGSRGEKRNGRAGDRGDGVHGLEDSDALISAGHRVAGFARSDESAWKLKERGIQPVKGNTADAGSLREAARGADAVAHAALIPDEGPRRQSVPWSGPCSTFCGTRVGRPRTTAGVGQEGHAGGRRSRRGGEPSG